MILSMFKRLKKIRYQIKAYKKLILNKESFLYQTGWMNSLHLKKPIDRDGNNIPWMNYSIVEFLKERLTKDITLFEYGSGFSTLFYSTHVNNVISIEYNKKWFEHISSIPCLNTNVYFYENDVDGKYCRSICDFDSLFNIVIVDGRDRVNCIKQSVSKLTCDGVLILDDSNRKYYKDGIIFLNEHGFRELSFYGLKPNEAFTSKTSVFYRDNNCLGI